jgi:UDP-glucose 4-epimerase
MIYKNSNSNSNLNNKINSKILVTGGAGFIGSHLCEKLSKLGFEVFSIDNYSTGSRDNHVENVTYVEGMTKDIEILINFRPDIVYHLGEYSRVEKSFDDIGKVWSYNKDGIFPVLQFCRKNQSKLIYAGSSTKFADGGLGRSQSPYAWTKASNADLIENYANWFGINYAIVYFYNVYGGREISHGKYATLIALFIEQYRNGEPLTVVSPGTQLRNFTHIDDIISGLIIVGERGEGDNYGIGSSESFSVLDIVKMFDSKFKMLPERKGNRMGGKMVSEKTKALGWYEKKSIKEYIEAIIINEK